MKKIIIPFKVIYGVKIPLPYTLLLLTVFVSFTYWKYHSYDLKAERISETKVKAPDCPSEMTQLRLHNSNELISPLLLADVTDESEGLKNLKGDISSLIQQKISSGQIANASVYLRRLNNGGWTCVNGSEDYNPGSLIKVAVLISYLHQAELNPGLLEKEIYCQPGRSNVPPQTFTEKAIEPGKKYPVKELLNYMILYSDNNATRLLNENMDIAAFQKLFTDLGMSTPDVHSSDFKISVTEFSKFMRILYNSSYLSHQDSDYALTLLTMTSFKDGMVKQLPADLKVAHKFGEYGVPAPGSFHQLHESGIIYFDNNPYLVTIMTKGADVKMLPEVISEIGKLVFDRVNVAG